jgi:protein KRI1
MPTRFKYATVQSQSFALTPSEILMATDAELNQYLSVKRYAPYRKEGRWDNTRNDRLKELKGKLAERSGQTGEDAEDGEKKIPRRKGKKERQNLKLKAAAMGPEASVATDQSSHQKRKDVGDDEVEKGAGKRKRRRLRKADESGCNAQNVTRS